MCIYMCLYIDIWTYIRTIYICIYICICISISHIYMARYRHTYIHTYPHRDVIYMYSMIYIYIYIYIHTYIFLLALSWEPPPWSRKPAGPAGGDEDLGLPAPGRPRGAGSKSSDVLSMYPLRIKAMYIYMYIFMT